MNIKRTLFCLPILATLGTGVALIACCSDSDPPKGESLTSTAAAVSGAADSHCGTKTVTVSEAACTAAPADDHDHDHDTGTGTEADAGDEADGGAAANADDYGPTAYNSEADDDDCKYHVKWTSGAVAENADASFQIVATTKADGRPLAGAPVSAEVFLDDSHPAPNSGQKTTETTPGTYVVGPIQFNAPGKWTVRFHFHEDCNDGEDSPHGHVAFFVQVP